MNADTNWVVLNEEVYLQMDGLAPVRSAKQDQIHSSIVSTLLGLMDGLDKRGQVDCTR